MNAYRDTKVTIWHREYFNFPNKTSNKEIIRQIRENEIISDVSEYLFDTSEDLPVDENQGFATEEIYINNSKLIFANGKH